MDGLGIISTFRKKSPQVQKSELFMSKLMNIFLSFSLIISFGCSKEPSQWDGSFEYPQHMFGLRMKKIIFLISTYLEA